MTHKQQDIHLIAAGITGLNLAMQKDIPEKGLTFSTEVLLPKQTIDIKMIPLDPRESLSFSIQMPGDQSLQHMITESLTPLSSDSQVLPSNVQSPDL